MLSAIIVAAYTFLTAHELWRERRRALRRWSGVVVPVLHGAIFLLPIPLSVWLPEEHHGLGVLASGWVALFAIEVLLYAIGMAFIVMVLSQDRVVSVHRTAAETDLLTGVCNRRAFLAGAQKVMAMQERRHGSVAVLLFDLDRFKSINDRFGHAIGDEVLRLFAQTGATAVRSSDVFARFGGEEFAVVLPGGIDEAAVVAERIRSGFEVRGAKVAGIAMDATVSIGAASANVPRRFDDKLVEQLLARADAALYRAKENGRNRIEYADPMPEALLQAEWALPGIASPPLAPLSEDAEQDVELPFDGSRTARA
jgi:diguanylate cyclase (GGDEF)-like protein